MKKTIIVLTTIIISAYYAFSQTTVKETVAGQFSNEIPNYIKAENSNFVVNIITSWTFKAVYVRNAFTNKRRIIGHKAVDQELDKFFFDTVSVLISERLEKLGLYPFSFVNVCSTEMVDTLFYKNQLIECKKNKTGFIIYIACSGWDKEKREFKKGKFLIENVDPVTFAITTAENRDPRNTYVLCNKPLTLGEALELFKNKIAEKPDSYFIKTMEIPQ